MKNNGRRSGFAKLSVREKTYRLLRKQVLTGKFAPGQRLTEVALAKGLGVSRTPVREALHKLEQDGLVEPAGARGFRVPEDSLQEMEELFEIRAILEGHALACLSRMVDKHDLRVLQELIDQAETACAAGKLERVFACNTSFHDLLYGLIARQKPRLYSMIEDMREYVLRYRKNTLLQLQAAKRSIAGHKKILMALELGDARLCERIMRTHIREARGDTMIRSANRDGVPALEAEQAQ